MSEETLNRPPEVTQKGFPVAKHRSKFKSRFGQKNKSRKTKVEKTTTRFREAMEMLKSMSEDEIKSAREELKSLLTAESVAFLRERGRKKVILRREYDNRDVGDFAAEKDTTEKVEDNITGNDLSKLVTDEDLMEAAKKSKGIERERLAWIVGKEKGDSKEDTDEDKEGAVRIDLNGRLVSPDDDPDRLRGLHHHGEHPDKAGYTIRELTMLGASAFPAQKATALKALASYYERQNEDNVMKVFDVKLIPTICMSLRSDRKNRTVWSATLALIRALGISVTRETDTECVDDCFENIFQPRGNENRELVEMLFSVQKIGFVRTCIQTLQTEEEKSSVCSLLLSCSRQSLSLASACYECVLPMFTRVLRCPQNYSYEYVSCVFELIRTICKAGKNLAERVCSDGVLDLMLRTLAVNAQDDMLKTESLRTWRACLRYGIPLAGTYFETLFPLLCKNLIPGKSSESKRVRQGSLLILEIFCRNVSNWSGASLRSIVSVATVSLEQNDDLDVASCALHVLASYLENCDEKNNFNTKGSILRSVEKYLNSSKIWQERVESRHLFVERDTLHNVYGVVRVLIAVEHDELLCKIWELVLNLGWGQRGKSIQRYSELARVTCVLLEVLKKRGLIDHVEAARVTSIVLPLLRRGLKGFVFSEGNLCSCRRVGDESFALELMSKHYFHLDTLRDLISSKLFTDDRHKHDFCMLLRDVLMTRATRLVGCESTSSYMKKSTRWPNLAFDRKFTETRSRFGLVKNTEDTEVTILSDSTWCLELLLENKTSSAAKIDMSMSQGVPPSVAKHGGATLVWLYSLEMSKKIHADIGVRAMYFAQALTQTSLHDMRRWQSSFQALLEMYVSKCSGDVLTQMLHASSETSMMSLVKSITHRVMMEFSKDSLLPHLLVRFILLSSSKKNTQIRDKTWRDLSLRGVLRFLDTAFEIGVDGNFDSSLVHTFVDLLLSSQELNKSSCPNICKYFVTQIGHNLFTVSGDKWNWDQIQMFERLLKSRILVHYNVFPGGNNACVSPLLLKNCSERLSSSARDFLREHLRK